MAPRDQDDYENLFPARLHYALEQADTDGLGDVIAWRTHGRAFLVFDRRRFETEFLPNWFQQRHWSSFQRQLNHYGFRRISADKNAYYHPRFVRGNRELCRHIVRAKIKGTGPRKASCPEDEPDFYKPELFGPPATTTSSSGEAPAIERAVQFEFAFAPGSFPVALAPNVLDPRLSFPLPIDNPVAATRRIGGDRVLLGFYDRPSRPLLMEDSLWLRRLPSHPAIVGPPTPTLSAALQVEPRTQPVFPSLVAAGTSNPVPGAPKQASCTCCPIGIARATLSSSLTAFCSRSASIGRLPGLRSAWPSQSLPPPRSTTHQLWRGASQS